MGISARQQSWDHEPVLRAKCRRMGHWLGRPLSEPAVLGRSVRAKNEVPGGCSLRSELPRPRLTSRRRPTYRPAPTPCPDGGIGRRTSFRCWRSQGRGGSSPLLGTICSPRIRPGISLRYVTRYRLRPVPAQTERHRIELFVRSPGFRSTCPGSFIWPSKLVTLTVGMSTLAVCRKFSMGFMSVRGPDVPPKALYLSAA